MAFDKTRLVCLFANGLNNVYAYPSFDANTDGDVGGTSGVYAGYLNGGKGFFAECSGFLRVGDIIFAGVSTAATGMNRTTGGVSGLVVTHVSATATAGVTVAGTSSFGKGAA
jgi:hypothetical protein